MANLQPSVAPKGADPRMVATIGVKAFDTTPRKGIKVKELDRFATLAKGGVQVGDEILALQGVGSENLLAAGTWQALFAKIGIGNTLKVTLARAGKQLELSMTVIGRKKLNLDLEEVDEVLERKIAPA